MRKLILFCTAICLSVSSFTQPTTDTFPDFTYTDLDGVTHNLQTYLDQGKYVVIDVFATWCPNCVNSISGWESLYELHGQAGDESMVLLSFERDPNTSNEEAFIVTHNIESPVITEAEDVIDGLWNITYQPRYFVICPDGSFQSELSTPIYGNPQPLIDMSEECPPVLPNSLTELENLDFQLTNTGRDGSLGYATSVQNLNYTILDVTGSIVTAGTLIDEQGQLDISGLRTGIYLLSVRSEKAIITLRFLRE